MLFEQIRLRHTYMLPDHVFLNFILKDNVAN